MPLPIVPFAAAPALPAWYANTHRPATLEPRPAAARDGFAPSAALQAVWPSRQQAAAPLARARGTDQARFRPAGGPLVSTGSVSDPPGPAAWAALVQGAVDDYQRKAAREQQLLAASAQDPTHPQVIADPVPAPADPTRMVFTPLPGADRFLFFNHRETFYPYELGADWRETQRAPGGLRLDAGAPAHFTVGASHADMGGHAAQVGLRFKNMGSAPLTLAVGGFAFKDQDYGGWAKRQAIDPVLAAGGTRTITLPPGTQLDLPVLRIEDQCMGAYQVEARVLSGQTSDLQVAELGRYETQDPGVGVDPWRHPSLGGQVPRLPIFLDGGKRVGLPSYFKTHQEFLGQALVSAVMPVLPGGSFKVEAYNFGVETSDDFPGRDRGYAYHVDHLARFTLPAGLPRFLRFGAADGGVNPQLSGQPLTTPDGKRVALTTQHPTADLPVDYLVAKGWLTRTPDGIYQLAVSFPNGSNAHVQVTPVY